MVLPSPGFPPLRRAGMSLPSPPLLLKEAEEAAVEVSSNEVEGQDADA